MRMRWATPISARVENGGQNATNTTHVQTFAGLIKLQRDFFTQITEMPAFEV